MTLSKPLRDLGRDDAPYGFHTSAQNSLRIWPIAVRFYGQLGAD